MANLSLNWSEISSCNEQLDLVFWVLNGAAGLVVLAGNLFTCVVFISSPFLRQNIMNIFLLSLAIADLLISFLLVPGYATFCEGCSHSWTKYCHILSSIKDVPLTAVIFNLLAISYDRYMAVLKPLHYHSQMNSLRVAKILSAVWGIPMFLLIPRFLIHNVLPTNRVDTVTKLYNTFLVTFFIFSPTVILVIVNTMLIRAVKRQKCRIQVTRNELVSENASTIIKEKEVFEKRTKRRKGTVSCIVVVLCFVICRFPRAFYNTWALANRSRNLNPVFLKVTMFLLILQSSVNPFIYSLYRREFRRAVKNLVHSLHFWRSF